MVKTSRAYSCCSLALLACSSSSSPSSLNRRIVGGVTASFLASSTSSRRQHRTIIRQDLSSSSSSFLRVTTTTTSSTFSSSSSTKSTTTRKATIVRNMSSSASASSTSHSQGSQIAANLEHVRYNIEVARREAGRSSSDGSDSAVRLVAVSKTKPISAIREAYDIGNHRTFGENYVQELVSKVQDVPPDVHWHFIGPLQSNKANLLVRGVVPYAASLTVETVASLKLAKKLNNAMMAATALSKDDNNDNDDEKQKQKQSSSSSSDVNEDNDNKDKQMLSIFIQVNTSGEETKSGVRPNEVVSLYCDIKRQCPLLNVKGLMTIGAPNDVTCFDILRTCRDDLATAITRMQQERTDDDDVPSPSSSLELSMGMSGDYQEAIVRGATNVRVGSTIFGAREYPPNTDK